MTHDPKSELIRQSGPLGKATSIPDEIVRNATPTQAAILYQNDQQIAATAELKGMVKTGFEGAHGRMDRMEKLFDERISVLERFNDRLMLVPEGMKTLIKFGGWSAVLSLGAWIAHILGIIN